MFYCAYYYTLGAIDLKQPLILIAIVLKAFPTFELSCTVLFAVAIRATDSLNELLASDNELAEAFIASPMSLDVTAIVFFDFSDNRYLSDELLCVFVNI